MTALFTGMAMTLQCYDGFSNFTAEDEETISVNFETTTSFEANVPYLIKTSKDIRKRFYFARI